MPNYICLTCGVQHAESPQPPDRCAICDDERQYVGRGGQQWTTLDELRAEGRQNRLVEVDPDVWSVHTTPHFGIGQRAVLIRTERGNFLWDMVSYIDDETVRQVNELGGLHGVSVSHPHFYGAMIEWSLAFGGIPVYVPEADAEYVMRPDPAIRWYAGEIEVWPGLSLVQVGGHFEGSAVVHWVSGAEGRGAIASGDSIAVAADRHWVTFMRSFPNYIPLPPQSVNHIVEALEPFEFDRIYGGWLGNDVREGGKEALRASGARYVHWSGGSGRQLSG